MALSRCLCLCPVYVIASRLPKLLSGCRNCSNKSSGGKDLLKEGTLCEYKDQGRRLLLCCMTITRRQVQAGACTCEELVGSRVKFHWSRPLLPAFCHIIEFIARSPSTSVSWNHLHKILPLALSACKDDSKSHRFEKCCSKGKYSFPVQCWRHARLILSALSAEEPNLYT